MKPQDTITPDSLREVLQFQSRQHPRADALLAWGRRSLDYAGLLEHVEAAGNSLRALGIGRSDRVAVLLPNGPEMAAVFLGVAAYAACAPLNPSYLRDELEFYLTDLSAEALVLPAGVDLPAREVAARLGTTVIDIEPSPHRLAGGFTLGWTPAEGPAPADWGRSEDVALVLHTSGTTSRPKQVPLSHRNLCSSARNVASVLHLSAQDRCLNLMPLFHIHGLVGVLLSSMCAGGAVICSAGFEGDSVAQLIHEFRPTWLSAVPTIHQSFLELAKVNPAVATGGHWRFIRSSSSALPPTVMAELEQTFGVPVIESYGMTEAAHQIASNPLPPAKRKAGSVGLPAGPEMAIIDDQGQLLSAGAIGEIAIRGPSVMRGYANNPDADQAAFTDGWFRTGDLGCRDEDGYFRITGRKKEMINRGGEKISPREIDEVLLEHPAVVQAIAFAVPHASLGEDVAAAVVLRADADVEERDLRAFALARLADFKVPSQFAFVPDIPKGPTGKLQRIGLYKTLASQLRADYVPPRTDLERSIATVIEQVLEADHVGVNDNFFGLGGDSLKAARALAELSSVFQVQLPAVALFLNPTAMELSLEITRLLAEDTGLLEQLLEEIEALPEDAARKLLEP